jgi:hypothetical protein
MGRGESSVGRLREESVEELKSSKVQEFKSRTEELGLEG